MVVSAQISKWAKSETRRGRAVRSAEERGKVQGKDQAGCRKAKHERMRARAYPKIRSIGFRGHHFPQLCI